MFSPPQIQQSLPQSPAHSVLPALPAPPVPPAVTVLNRNYVRPITAIQSVSAEASDPSLQVQVRDEEIELLHVQIEHLQQINFPEYITGNSQVIAPPTSSLGAACVKHLLQAFASLGSECQAGIYCPECTELCPLSMSTVIHCCQNCAEFYCLLCAHEYGYCLACEIEPSASRDEPSQPSHAFINQSSGKASDVASPAVSQLLPQFKAPLPPIKQTRVRCRHESDSSREHADSVLSDDAASLPRLDLHNSPLSQSDLTVLQQLHRRLRSLEVHAKNFECLFKAKDIMIRNVREKMT